MIDEALLLRRWRWTAWMIAATLPLAIVGCRATKLSDASAANVSVVANPNIPPTRTAIPPRDPSRASAPATVTAADRALEPGVTFRPVDQPNEVGTKTHLWVYLPAHVTGKIPCVLIGAAGTPLVWGMDLGEGDRPEHLPYAREGFAVIAYSLQGNVPNENSFAINPKMTDGIAAFRKANAGVSDARAAIDYALSLPQVDPDRLYTAGHSSAGTVALLAAENDARIRACVAYAPVTNCALQESLFAIHLRRAVPGIADFLWDTSPAAHPEKLRCPLFLFHADDDGTVSFGQVVNFRSKVAETNPHVTYVAVRSGGHYQSMIDEGIPRGIAWLKALSGDFSPLRHAAASSTPSPDASYSSTTPRFASHRFRPTAPRFMSHQFGSHGFTPGR